MRFLVVVLLAACSSGNSLAATPKQRVTAMERSLIPARIIKGEARPPATLAARMEQLKIPGLSVAVFNGGKIEWVRAYGYADKERGIRATPDTLFQAGSISKAVAALAALQLVETGALELDADVNDRLKSWHLPDNAFTVSHKVTLHSILNHTAGTTVSGFPGYERTDKIPSPIDDLEGRGKTEAIRVWKEPGQSWSYSGGGYLVMQVLMSDVTGRPFPDLMRHNVLNPLGMESSTFELTLSDKWQARAAYGYNGWGAKVAGGWHVYPEMAAAGLWTTATDLAKFGLAVQRMYRGDGGVLSRQMAHEMLTPDMKDDGLGMFITSDGKRFYHGGHNEGFLASVTAYFEGGAGIAIMTNSDNGGQLIDELMLTIAREYGWSGFSQVEKTAVHLTSADYERLTGHYKVDAGGAGEFDLVSEGRRIVMRSTEMPERELLAESADQLFFRDDFTSVEVATENGSTALKFDGWIHAVKIP